ncbi:MAG TPA: SDR family NAD(P)-dependent oxidoreductase, partial [Polyangiales bacterium]
EAWQPLARGEVRITVRSAGVNFRDVMSSLGLVDAPGLGLEVAGEVLEVGEGVAKLAVGDRVMGLASAAFATTAVGDARLLTRIPAQLSFAQAATIPVVFLTALYGLRDLAGLRAGERALIHAGAGGVGMAAIQLAQRFGAEVYATASRAKWGVLRAGGISSSRVASSRDTTFEAQFAVAGGLDVVLNSLAGEYVDASLRLLARGGRFLEMGKTDVRDAAEVNATHGVSYQAFDLMEAGPELLEELLEELREWFERGELQPLPLRAYDLRHARSAFGWLANGRNVGKLVLQPPRELAPEGTVLITGGVGELGRELARHLVQRHGVRHLVLTSRRGLDTPGAGELVTSLQSLGAEQVRVLACDVSERAELARVLDAIDPTHPLTGVVHLAGVLDDGLLADLTSERLATVLRPKVHGAWHLHALTRERDLAAFVLFSSVAGVLGNAGQGSYAAANTFLDALAAERRKQGLAAQSLAWGLWEPQGQGMTSQLNSALLLRIRRSGLLPLSIEHGMSLLDTAWQHPGAQLVPARLELGRMGKQLGSESVPPLLRALIKPSLRRVEAARVSASALRDRLAPLSEGERLKLLLGMVQEVVATVLGLASPAAVPPNQPLKDLGLDSLMAVEVRNQLSARAETKLPATLVFDYPTPEAIAKLLLSQAFARLSASRAPLSTRRVQMDEPIAVLAMACRAPGGVVDPESFWQLLAEGRDAVSAFPSRWDVDALYDPDPDAMGKTYAREGGFLADVEKFDAGFFGIAPREAVSMDPQQRLVLEASWEALERAGLKPNALNETSTGVYLGSVGSDYGADAGGLDSLDGHGVTGQASSVLSGRISYVLGLQGPALTVDTACSSSLVALHLACAGLRQGECDLALAGGVQVMSTPSIFVEFSRLRGMARDGRCKSFSEAADGAGWAEGCGVLVLKRLSDAQRDGDEVLAVLRGSAVNQDGRSQGLTAPNGPAQQRVIQRALAVSGLQARDIDALEAHGTGTSLGDPIEAGALAAVFGPGRAELEPLYLGSSKSNLGHAQAAAGVLGVIKMVLALKHEQLPKTLHAEEPSSHVSWEGSGLALLQQPRAWARRTGRIRRAGVSSFGISGTNAHVIVEEAPSRAPSEPKPVALAVPLLLSGRDERALREQALRMSRWLASRRDGSWGSVLRTAAVHRTHFEHRAALLVPDAQGAEQALARLSEGGSCAELITGRALGGELAMLFTGQGSQRVGMGRELY